MDAITTPTISDAVTPPVITPSMVPVEAPLLVIGEQRKPLTFDPWEVALTEEGNAERFAYRYENDARYCHDLQSWLLWNGQRWEYDRKGQIIELGGMTAKAIFEEIPKTSHDRQQHLVAWARQSCSRYGINAMVQLSQPKMSLASDQLDRNLWLLNCKNGVLDLKTGELRAPRREDWITKQIPITYDPNAKCDRFRSFMHQITGGDGKLEHFIQKCLGYSLTGETREQCCFIAYGEGANGKSTLFNLIRRILGDYAKNSPVHTFTQKKTDGGPREDLVRLKDARFVTCAEAEENQKVAVSLLKQITGGDTVAARELYKGMIEYVPQFKLWLMTNHKPKIDGSDPAIWRRIKLIPFNVVIPKNERDPELGSKLMDEASGILTWAVRGALYWQYEGLEAPDTVKKATKEYQSEMDDVRRFIDECVRPTPEHSVPKRAMFNAYREWANQNESDRVSMTKLSQRLSAAGLQESKSGSQRLWKEVVVSTNQSTIH